MAQVAGTAPALENLHRCRTGGAGTAPYSPALLTAFAPYVDRAVCIDLRDRHFLLLEQRPRQFCWWCQVGRLRVSACSLSPIAYLDMLRAAVLLARLEGEEGVLERELEDEEGDDELREGVPVARK